VVVVQRLVPVVFTNNPTNTASNVLLKLKPLHAIAKSVIKIVSTRNGAMVLAMLLVMMALINQRSGSLVMLSPLPEEMDKLVLIRAVLIFVNESIALILLQFHVTRIVCFLHGVVGPVIVRLAYLLEVLCQWKPDIVQSLQLVLVTVVAHSNRSRAHLLGAATHV